MQPETICFRPGAEQNVTELPTRFRLKTTDPILLYSIEANCKNNSSNREPLILLCGQKKNQQSTKAADLPCQCPIAEDRLPATKKIVRKPLLMCVNYSPENLDAAARLLISEEEHTDYFYLWNTLLILSRFYGQKNLFEIVHFLVDTGIDVNAETNDEWNALHFVIRFYKGENLIDIVRLLIEKGIDVNAQDHDNYNALHFVTRYYKGDNLIDLVHLLIEKGIDVNAKTNYDETALHYVSKYYSGDHLINIARLLIEKGINVKAIDRRLKKNALHIVLGRNYKDLIEIVELLIDNGIDVNQMDRYKENALIKLCEYSLSNKIFEVAELLISNGADVDQTNINGRSAAYYINQRSNEEVPKKSQILDLLKKHSRG